MPCPLFLPGPSLNDFASGAAPLGGLCRGICAAAPEEEIADATLRACCNFGYARGLCARAAAVEVDAVRFLIQSHERGMIGVAWSKERDHHPVAVGTLRLTEIPAANGVLEVQARAYVSAYLSRTGRTW